MTIISVESLKNKIQYILDICLKRWVCFSNLESNNRDTNPLLFAVVIINLGINVKKKQFLVFCLIFEYIRSQRI